MLKRLNRAVVRRVRRYLGIPSEPRVWGNYANEDFAYASINRLLDTLQAEGGKAMRAQYTWGVLQAAQLAKSLQLDRICVLEFGVAGGNGLVALELAAERIEPIFGVKIDVHGFDTGRGLPKPSDYRDMPNLYPEAAYAMDVEKLKQRLTRAQLHLGLVAETVGPFLQSNPAPIAFISFDVDYYSSTMDAFKVLEADYTLLLPRVHCYFDDIMGTTCSEFTGERLAIAEFNDWHERRKLAPIYGLRYFLTPRYAQEQWSEMMYLAHFFDHPLHNHHDGLIRRSNENDHTRLKPTAPAPGSAAADAAPKRAQPRAVKVPASV